MPDAVASVKRWVLQDADEALAAALADALGIRPLYGRLLAQRGIRSFEEARHFFRPSLDHLHDPWAMKGMRAAVERLDQARRRGERVLVYGDYDVDGTAAVAMMASFLRDRGLAVEAYLPDRYREGYGLSLQGIDHALGSGCKVLLALDCGIRALSQVAYASSRGLACIICDHHLPDRELPQALAILNPRQPGCGYPCKDLCGCGVGFKLLCALAEHWGEPADARAPYLDLVATATAADIVPLRGENRVLAYHGLQRLNEQASPGLAALLAERGKGGWRLEDLVYGVAPQVNAAGRMGDARRALDLLSARDPAAAAPLAEALRQANAARREAEGLMTREALALLEGQPAGRRTTVLYQPGWHKGVAGIVASRVMERHYRPTVILTRSEDRVTGSGRSVRGFNICEALDGCRELLDSYGGHAAAAGVTLAPERVADFAEAFERAVAARIDPALLIPTLRIDAELELGALSPKLFGLIAQFGPFGPANPAPVFMARAARDTGGSRLLKNAHIRFELQQEGAPPVTGIGFYLGDRFPLVASGAPFDLCFTLEENEWKGQRRREIRVLDLRPADGAPLPEAGELSFPG